MGDPQAAQLPAAAIGWRGFCCGRTVEPVDVEPDLLRRDWHLLLPGEYPCPKGVRGGPFVSEKKQTPTPIALLETHGYRHSDPFARAARVGLSLRFP
jgi:hypothetical protein